MSISDDLRARVARLPAADEAAVAACGAHEARLTKPAGALGRLEEVSAWLCGWQRRHPPRLDRVRIAVFAGWHGVTARGVSAYPAEVTGQMVANFEAGGAAINQLARLAAAELEIVPLRRGEATADLSRGPAMGPDELAEALVAGAASVTPGLDLLVPGEMGIANTTAAAAICAALLGGDGRAWAGPGTGLDDRGVRHKAEVIDEALAHHAAHLAEPVEVLRRLGGREIAAMTGAILAAREAGVPVLLDGFVASTAAAALHAMSPHAVAHCLAGHRSAEPGHRRLLERLGMTPLLDLGMRLGEGSGAAVAINVVRAAVACHAGMATFEAARVSGRA